jgi:hypothetical protein
MARELKDLIEPFLQNRAQHDWRVCVAQRWNIMVGSMHEQMVLERIEQATLMVGVRDVHWMHEFFCLKPLLIKTINEQLGAPHVRDIHFRLLSPDQHKKSYRSIVSTGNAKVVYQHKNLSHQERTALSAIADDELQQVLTDFWHCCHKG